LAARSAVLTRERAVVIAGNWTEGVEVVQRASAPSRESDHTGSAEAVPRNDAARLLLQRIGFDGVRTVVVGEPPGSRTQNRLIKSQLLCQLS
jgi:hypothetical protein